MTLYREKLEQAGTLVAAAGADVWLTFVRETEDGGDPVLPLLVSGGLTWQSALIVTGAGDRVAVVGSYDAGPLEASGDWTEVIPYIRAIREPLLAALDRLVPADRHQPRIAINFSPNDDKADGLSHGMYLLLEEYLSGTRFAGSLIAAEEIVGPLRARKTAAEIAAMRAAIAETDWIFAEVGRDVRAGMAEREVYDLIHGRIDAAGLGCAWAQEMDPIVNSGPDSMIGHGVPSADIRIEPGHILHIDLGVNRAGYSSDIQRCWYVPADGETAPPDDVQSALDAVLGAINAGANAIRTGVLGWQVDKKARTFLVAQGYPEYMHALGHQVGRRAHDGGGILGPIWERYGRTPYLPIERDQVYTVELGVMVDGRGYLGIEEMVRVTDDGIEWLTERQLHMPLLRKAG